MTEHDTETRLLKITAAEARLYDDMAPVIRLLGMGLHAAERAQQLAEERTRLGHDADNATLHGGESVTRDEHGRSPHTAWVESVNDRLARFERDFHQLYQEVASEALAKAMEMGPYARSKPVG